MIKSNYTKRKEAVKKNIGLRLFYSILSISFFAIMAIVLTINLAVSGTIDWSLYPIGALLSILIIVWPLCYDASGYKYIISMTLAIICIIAYCTLIMFLTQTSGWVLRIVIPCMIALLLPFYGAAYLSRKIKLGLYGTTGLYFISFGVISHTLIQFITNWYTMGNPFDFSNQLPNLIIGINCLCVAIILFIIEFSQKKQSTHQ